MGEEGGVSGRIHGCAPTKALGIRGLYQGVGDELADGVGVRVGMVGVMVGVTDGVGVSEAVGEAIGVQTGMVRVGNGVRTDAAVSPPEQRGGTL